MLRCREISRLVSESMDHDLSFRQRMQMRMHLAMCRLCSGFARQLRLLRRAARENPERLTDTGDDTDSRLSDEARERIKTALKDR